MRVTSALVLSAALIAPASGEPAAAEPPLKTVLARAAAYVAEFQRVLSGIVAEERYEQVARSRPLTETMRISLKSDLLLVRPRDANEWAQYRDVFEVDGRPVRDREERLTKLFLEPSEPGRSQMMSILNESARYNIGGVIRNVNTPLFTLRFLEGSEQPRFRFKRVKDAVPAAVRDAPDHPAVFRASTEVWAVEFQETERPTIIRTVMNKDVPARGRFWIDPNDGRVLMAELVTDRDVHATIDVSFQSEPVLGLLVPIEMRERYEGRRDGSVIVATASYGHFRQFQVNVDQTFLLRK
jgi:hypothetical protein